MVLWTGRSRAEHYCPLHPDLTQQHCHFSFNVCVCVWVCVKELWRFQTTEAFGLGVGGGEQWEGVTLGLGGHVEKSESEMESSKAAGRSQKGRRASRGFLCASGGSRGWKTAITRGGGEREQRCSLWSCRHDRFYSPSTLLLLPRFEILVVFGVSVSVNTNPNSKNNSIFDLFSAKHLLQLQSALFLI